MLGTSFPHLLNSFGATLDWTFVLLTTSILATLGGLLIYLFVPDGPFRKSSSQIDLSACFQVFKNKNFRAAAFGYFGHMWELYAMWSWIGVALAVSFAFHMPTEDAIEFAKLITFFIIAAGAISCPLAGWFADKVGKAELTIIAMAVSGTCAVLFALTFSGSVWVTIVVSIIWGIAIIPDSAQFSVLVADHAAGDQAGSLMTFQTALGFALTILTVQVSPVIAAKLGWPVVMSLLALGPLFGIVSMWGLRKSVRR